MNPRSWWIGLGLAPEWGATSDDPFSTDDERRPNMLRAALAFFIIALVAALFGFGGLASGAAGIAKILFAGFVILALVALVAGTLRR